MPQTPHTPGTRAQPRGSKKKRGSISASRRFHARLLAASKATGLSMSSIVEEATRDVPWPPTLN